jgi:hypothetical protein
MVQVNSPLSEIAAQGHSQLMVQLEGLYYSSEAIFPNS